MSKFLAPRNEFYGEVIFAEGSTVNVSGESQVGDPSSVAIEGTDVWNLLRTAARVADKTERDNYLDYFTDTFGAPTVTNPCTVWRADGTSTGLLEQSWNGSDWTPLTHTAGDMEMTLAQGAPPGWILAQGQTLTNAASMYPALWENASWGWRVGSSLVLPDLRGRVPVGHGQGAGLTNRTIGQKGGAEKVQLAQSETPLKKHMHGGFDWRNTIRSFIGGSFWKTWRESGSSISGSGHTYLLHSKPTTAPYGEVDKYLTVPPVSHVGAPVTPPVTPLGYGAFGTSETESDSASPHENMQPFVVVNYKIKL